jgi:hypothetical protein
VATWFYLKLSMLVAAVLLAGVAINGCGELDTVLFVRVDGATTGTISQFRATITIGGEGRMFTIPDQKRRINLPTSFTVEIPPDFKGDALVQVDALNDQGVVIGEGMASITAIGVGEKNTIDVQIAPVLVSPPDAGVGGNPPAKDAAIALDSAGDAKLITDVGVTDAGSVNLDASKVDAPKNNPDASVRDASSPKLDAPVVAPDAAVLDASDDASPIVP